MRIKQAEWTVLASRLCCGDGLAEPSDSGVVVTDDGGGGGDRSCAGEVDRHHERAPHRTGCPYAHDGGHSSGDEDGDNNDDDVEGEPGQFVEHAGHYQDDRQTAGGVHSEILHLEDYARRPRRRLFTYAMTVFANMAPCDYRGCLSLAICKPLVRSAAAIGDVVIGLVSSTLYRVKGLVAYVGVVDSIVPTREYYDAASVGYAERPDCIYQATPDGRLVHKRQVAFHCIGPGADGDRRKDSTGSVLLFSQYVCFPLHSPGVLPDELAPFAHHHIGNRRVAITPAMWTAIAALLSAPGAYAAT